MERRESILNTSTISIHHKNDDKKHPIPIILRPHLLSSVETRPRDLRDSLHLLVHKPRLWDPPIQVNNSFLSLFSILSLLRSVISGSHDLYNSFPIPFITFTLQLPIVIAVFFLNFFRYEVVIVDSKS